MENQDLKYLLELKAELKRELIIELKDELSIKSEVELKIKNVSTNLDPSYANPGDSGFDLRAWFEGMNKTMSITLKPLERMLIHTGLYLDIPKNYEIQVRPRSGCSNKLGLTVVNTPGTVDEPYVGEICIIAINLSNQNLQIVNGDRIAQAVLMPVSNSNLTKIVMVSEIIKETERGSSGFGDSGIK